MIWKLESAEDIRKATHRLLRKADALGVYPTPVEQIIDAAGLSESHEDLFAEDLVNLLPAKFRRAVLKLKTKVLAALDRTEKLIYINKSEGNVGAIAFRRLHEVAHKIFPWQQDLVHVDDAHTLAPAVHALFEREANSGAAELLFQHDHFGDVARDYRISLLSVIELHNKFGSSIHAAFRRYIEHHSGSLFGIVVKPQDVVNPVGVFKRNEIVQSPKWLKSFGDGSGLPQTLPANGSDLMRAALLAQAQPCEVVECAAIKENLSGRARTIRIEAFYNSYVILLLAWDPKSHSGIRAKRHLVV